MDPDSHDDLWKLLGKARQPTVSPFFSRNVLRAVRHQQNEGLLSVWSWLRRRWQIAAIAVVALCLGTAGVVQHGQRQQITLLAQQVFESPDYGVITELDELLAGEEDSVWLENVN